MTELTCNSQLNRQMDGANKEQQSNEIDVALI